MRLKKPSLDMRKATSLLSAQHGRRPRHVAQDGDLADDVVPADMGHRHRPAVRLTTTSAAPSSTM